MKKTSLKVTLKAAGMTLLVCLIAIPVYAFMMTGLLAMLFGSADVGLGLIFVLMINVPLVMAWWWLGGKLMAHYIEGFSRAG